MKDTYILGINSAYHEPAACLLKNGEIIAAVEEERFNRIRHGKFVSSDSPHELPYSSIDYCLKAAGINFKDVDYIGYSFSPKERLKKNLNLNVETIPGELGSVEGEEKFYKLLMKIPSLLKKRYGIDVKQKFIWVPHHLCHCASAFYMSPYKEAAILSTDGIGEFACTMFAYGKNNKIKVIKEIGYPNSLGFLWTKASQYLNLMVGGRAEYGAGKVMALAAYGFPDKFYNKFKSFIEWNGEGNFFVDEKIAQFRSGSLKGFERIFGKPRKPFKPLKQKYIDFSAALQKITNEALLAFANYLHKKTKSKNLCRAGGVALNCVANTLVLEKSPFERVFVEPAANDMGTALGVAYYIWHDILNKPRSNTDYLKYVYLGTEYSNEEIEKALKNSSKIKYGKVPNIEKMAAYLIANGLVVGWFQGRMEFGPRALGNRSILADPRRAELYEKVSKIIKGREFFRPLAPSILEEHVDEWFQRPRDGSDSDQFMIFSYKLKNEKLGLVPAVTHVDNSGRLQTVNKCNERFYNLIKNFYKLTEVPIVINTSFNRGEPIVEKPEQAINTFLNSAIDTLVIGDYIVFKKTELKKSCQLFECAGKAISIKKFVEKWIDKTGLTDHEKSILLSVNLPEDVPLFLKKPRTRAEWLAEGSRKTLKAEVSGLRSALWKEKSIKFKGCNPQPKKFFPRESFFFGKEKEMEDVLPFGVLTKEQVMRELLGWAFFSKTNLGLSRKPLCVYDYGIGCCLVLESKEEKRVEKFFDFQGITLADMALQTRKTKNLPKQVGLKGIDITSYTERKASLLAEMNFNGGFRDLLNSNIGNDFLDHKQIYLGDFDSFRAIKIPKMPTEKFLKKFYLQCFVEAIKSSLPIIEQIQNCKETISPHLKISSLYKAYRKEFFTRARVKGWNIPQLKKIEKWAASTPVFIRAVRKMAPSYRLFESFLKNLPTEELAYKIH